MNSAIRNPQSVMLGLMVELPVSRAFAMPLVVSPQDIDEQGHASNVAVLSWMNRAAWRHSIVLGWDVADYRRIGGWFVVRRHEVDYHHRAMVGDELIAYTWPSALGKVSAERRHYVVRPADGALVAEGLNIWAFIDAETGKPRRIPAEVAASFEPSRFA